MLLHFPGRLAYVLVFLLSGVQFIIIIESRGGQRAEQLTPSKQHERPAPISVGQHKKTTIGYESAKARTSTFRVQNPNIIPWAVRVGAAHGGAAWCGGAVQNRTPTSRVAKKPADPLAPQSIVNICPERPLASTNKESPT